jgi:uncharacterized membrane protein
MSTDDSTTGSSGGFPVYAIGAVVGVVAVGVIIAIVLAVIIFVILQNKKKKST